MFLYLILEKEIETIKWSYTAVFKQFVERDETNNLNKNTIIWKTSPQSHPCQSHVSLSCICSVSTAPFISGLSHVALKYSGSVQQNGPRWTDNRKFVSELSGVVRNIRAKITMFDYRESGNSNHRVASVHRKKVEWFVSIWRLNFWSTSSLYIRPSAS